jgi:hypothetical protein
MALLGPHIPGIGRSISYRLVTIGATGTVARPELTTIRRVAGRNDAKVSGQALSVSFVREGTIKVADLWPRKHAGPQGLVGPGNAPRLMAHAAEAARLPQRRPEELSREIVTSDARGMGKVPGHGLVGVSGLLFGRQVTISALDLHVLLLIVRKRPASGPVLRLFRAEGCHLISA